MRILVSNDDGIDSVGLHVLARAMQELGDVVVAAPDTEYSGASTAVGALHLMRPEIHRAQIDGVNEAWAVTGPPALCVMFSRLEAFGPPFDLVVAGINPGANVGRSIYHSGTVGAALTARLGGITGVAVSQDVSMGSIEGQAWDDMIADMRWDSAAAVATEVVRTIIAAPPAEPSLLNVNVPNLPVSQIKGWKHTELSAIPGRSFGGVTLEPKIGHEGAFRLQMSWGTPNELPDHTDAGAVAAGYVSLTWLSKIVPVEAQAPGVAVALDAFLGTAG